MDNETITFQLATHFLSRTALRMECLFKTVNEACHESHEVIHRYALKNIIELIEIIEKPELKSRFIKELIRIEHVLKKYTILQNEVLFDRLAHQIHVLNHVPGLFGSRLQEDNFLKILRQIHHPHTKECEFNSPHLVLWFNAPADIRQKRISQWLNHLKDLENTVDIYLALLRETAKYFSITATNGFYQHNISPKFINHLILLKMHKSLEMTPKIQLGHHNLTIRLYNLNTAEEIKNKSLDMEIAFCEI